MTLAANIDDLDRPADVVGAFFAAARANPHRPAIAGNGRELCYVELERLVLDLARRLGPDCGMVGVLVTRSANTIVALLGTLAAGGSYCPIDPTFPLERQRALLRNGGARLVVATAPGQRNPSDLPLVELPGVAAERAVPEHALEDGIGAAAEPDRPAYLLFTSGSTGEPKGVLTPRRAIDAAVRSLRELFAITPADRVLQFASLNWDTCFEEILPTLTQGAALVFDDEAYTGSLPRFLRMVARERVTRARPADRVLARAGQLSRRGARRAAGQRAAGDHRRRGGAARRGWPTGARSTRPGSAWSTPTARPRPRSSPTPSTCTARSRSRAGPTTPSRCRSAAACRTSWSTSASDGELLVGGPALALGYLGLPEATAARFPLLDLGDGPRRYFRTGDRVSRAATARSSTRPARQPAQDPRHPGRPRRGRGAARRHSGVAAVAVAGVSVADHTALAAYVVPRASADARTLGATLFADLRGARPGPSRARPPSRRPGSRVHRERQGRPGRFAPAPRGSIQLQRGTSMSADGVVQIFRRVLETDDIDADSDFFVLGGDSLLATRVLSAHRPRVRRRAVVRRTSSSSLARGVVEADRRARCHEGHRGRGPGLAGLTAATDLAAAAWTSWCSRRASGSAAAPTASRSRRAGWVDAGAAYLGDRHTGAPRAASPSSG